MNTPTGTIWLQETYRTRPVRLANRYGDHEILLT
jgi:hypothetical protein